MPPLVKYWGIALLVCIPVDFLVGWGLCTLLGYPYW